MYYISTEKVEKDSSIRCRPCFLTAAQIPIEQSSTLKKITTDSIACNQKLSGVDIVYPPWVTFRQFT